MCLWNMIYGNLIDIRIEDLYRANIDVTDHTTLSNIFDMTFRTDTSVGDYPEARGRQLRQRADKFVKLSDRRANNLTGG